MPINSFSIGHDISVDIIDPVSNKLYTFDAITEFKEEQQTKTITSEPLNGPPQFAEAPNGWKGSFSMDRRSPAADLFIAAMEDNYWGGQNTLSGSITRTTTEPTASAPTQFKYSGVSFKFGEAGNWKAQEKVMQRVDWIASRRQRVV